MSVLRDFGGVIWIGILRLIVGLLAIATAVEIFNAIFPGSTSVQVNQTPDYFGAVFLSLRLLILISFIAATSRYREQWMLLQAARDYAEDRCSLDSFGSTTKEILKRI